jgi:hypothetical protein
MRARTEDDLAACMGWLDSFAVALVVALDTRTPMQVRPFPGHWRLRTEEGPLGALLFGLDRPGSAELDTVIEYFRVSFFERWTERPEGSELSYAVLPRARLLERLKPGR